MDLVSGDDHGEDTAIKHKLHAVVFSIRVQVCVNNFLQNWFVLHIISDEPHQSAPFFSQPTAQQKYVLNVFIQIFSFTGRGQEITFPVR